MIDDRHKILALALAHCAMTEDRLADLVPPECWDRLHQEGFLRLESFAPGDDPTSSPTQAGYDWLRKALR